MSPRGARDRRQACATEWAWLTWPSRKDTDSQGWLKRLEWDRNIKVQTFELKRLTPDAVKDVLQKLGGLPKCWQGKEPSFIAFSS
jgi:hypothetical protein